MSVTESYFVASYWGVRKESADQCGRRLTVFLETLRDCDPILARWFRKGDAPLAGGGNEIGIVPTTLTALLGVGVNRKDFGRQIIEDLGFRVNLWNGAQGARGASLSVKCGSYAPRPGINSCVVSFGASTEKDCVPIPLSLLLSVLESMARAWDPDWGLIDSNLHFRTNATTTPSALRAGWAMFLSRKFGLPAGLPPAVQIFPLDNLGSIVVTTGDQFTASNRSHVDLADSITTILQAGVREDLSQVR